MFFFFQLTTAVTTAFLLVKVILTQLAVCICLGCTSALPFCFVFSFLQFYFKNYSMRLNRFLKRLPAPSTHYSEQNKHKITTGIHIYHSAVAKKIKIKHWEFFKTKQQSIKHVNCCGICTKRCLVMFHVMVSNIKCINLWDNHPVLYFVNNNLW